MTLYLYADEQSRETLLDSRQKVVLIGGDFGYGNFGDLLQHINAVQLVQKSNRFATVSILRSNAISFHNFPSWAKTHYGTDATLFLADYPLILDESGPKLLPVAAIRNIASIYLYGGGFLNSLWGQSVLNICEYFLRLAPQASYLVSGQQVSTPFQKEVIKHTKTFPPILFGVRDTLSQQWLSESGYAAEFSFDDATEILLDLSERAPLIQGPGLALHLNSSDYTANDLNRSGIVGDLHLLRACQHGHESVTLFQAFRDTRHNVYDSRETLKRLDSSFPFTDLRLIETTRLIFEQDTPTLAKPITASIGYSCSYHITLWLQLNGIPCWLRSNNPYYDQKSRALQIQQSLPDFLHEPKNADHHINLERRAKWLEIFSTELNKIQEVDFQSSIPLPSTGPAPWPFFFKGQPTLENQMQEMEDNHTNQLQELNRRIGVLTAQITTIGNNYHEQNKYVKNLEGELTTRNAELQTVRHDAALLLTQLNSILHSRSWRLTRILRDLGQVARRWRNFFYAILPSFSRRS